MQEIFSNSNNYIRIQNLTQRIICRRENYTGDFEHVLQNIETYMQKGEILKNDVSTTVVKLNNIVIKHFNTKSRWHRIKRSFYQSRAAKCWKNAHFLLSHKIATPQPLAIVEKKSFWLRGETYYVMEYVDGALLDIYLKNLNDQTEQSCYLDKLVDIFNFFKQNHIRYRDPKTDNFLVAKNNIFLLDLDDMQKLSAPIYFLTRAWQKDSRRLIKYWNNYPKIQTLLREKLCQKIK